MSTSEPDPPLGAIDPGSEPVDPLLEAIADPETSFAALTVDAPRVGIVMSSKSDLPIMEIAEQELTERGIRSELRVMAPFGDQDTVTGYARNARMRGLRVIIVGASLSAALPSLVAANTDLPVIGVPLIAPGSVGGGLDALISIAQAPPGLAIATVGVDNARNAALVAARILTA